MRAETHELLEEQLNELNELYHRLVEWSDELTSMSLEMEELMSTVSYLTERAERLLEEAGN